MTNVVYTNYWINERDNVKKEHGSYKTEQEAIEAIRAWWEIHREKHRDISYERTNRGALEVLYGDTNYYYRIEKREIPNALPSKSYKVKSQGEIDSLRLKHQLDDETLIFDELSEPYRDRLVIAFSDVKKCREYTYTEDGQPITKLRAI